MENNPVLGRPALVDELLSATGFDGKELFREKPALSLGVLELVSEDGVNLFNYLESFNLLDLTNLILLPSDHQNYYDEIDLRSVKTLISLKRLNQIENLDSFFCTLNRIVPTDTNFVGYFSDHRSFAPIELFSRIFARIKKILVSEADGASGKRGISELLEKWGFRVVDMKEINGLTYFYSKKLSQVIRIRA